jgi:hypothetical protein
MHFEFNESEFQKKAKVAIEAFIENPKHYFGPFASKNEGLLFSLALPATILLAPFLIIISAIAAILSIMGLLITLIALSIKTAHSFIKPQELERHAYFKLKTIYAALFTATSSVAALLLPIAAVLLPFAAFGLFSFRSINTLAQSILNIDENDRDSVFDEMEDVDLLQPK